MICECINCHKKYEPNKFTSIESKFCSRNCGQSYRREHRGSNNHCKCCGKLTNNDIYCSTSCSAKYQKVSYKEKNYTEIFNKLLEILPTIDFTISDLIEVAGMLKVRWRKLYDVIRYKTQLTPAKFIFQQTGIDIVNIKQKRANKLFCLLDEIVGVGEREKMFNSLRNANGNMLKFDWLNATAKLVVEYNGPQHYYNKKRCFFYDEEKYNKITDSANRKINFCKANSYNIIFWPYYKKIDNDNINHTLISSQAQPSQISS